MVRRTLNDPDWHFKLIREALWNLEDKISSLLNSITDHDADIAQLRRTVDLLYETRPRPTAALQTNGGEQHAS